jgi:hypothetical protein
VDGQENAHIVDTPTWRGSGGMKSNWHSLRIPALIAICSAIGLAVGLLGDSGYDFVSWIGLSIPIIAILYGIRRSRRA